MLKEMIDNIMSAFGADLLDEITLGECMKRRDDKIVAQLEQIYFVCGWDDKDNYPLYIGATVYGLRRIRQHLTTSGSIILRNIIETSLPESYYFRVYLYSSSCYFPHHSFENKLTDWLRPWIFTRTKKPTLFNPYHRDYFPEYILAYQERLKTDAEMKKNEEKRWVSQYYRRAEQRREIERMEMED